LPGNLICIEEPILGVLGELQIRVYELQPNRLLLRVCRLLGLPAAILGLHAEREKALADKQEKRSDAKEEF
jgi:hypothetical protein